MKAAMLLAVLAAATGCSSNAIRAIERDGRPSQVVRFDDLDITDRADAQILYARIRTAAVQVCGSVPAPMLRSFGFDLAFNRLPRVPSPRSTQVSPARIERLPPRQQRRR